MSILSKMSFKIRVAPWDVSTSRGISQYCNVMYIGKLTYYRHSSKGTKPVILKEIAQDYGIRTNIYSRAGSCPHVRSLLDTAPDRNIFVFEYLNENLLHLARKELSAPVAKHILKSALLGLAALHEQDIVHNGDTKSPYRGVELIIF